MLHVPCRYLEERCRLLPQLEKEHSHARVPHEELEERMTNHLSASSFTPLALLQWQLTGRGSPFSLGKLLHASAGLPMQYVMTFHFIHAEQAVGSSLYVRLSIPHCVLSRFDGVDPCSQVEWA